MNGHVDLWEESYQDGELDAWQKQMVDSHLEVCPRCREQMAKQKALSALLHEVPPMTPELSEARFVSQVNLRLERRAPALSLKQRSTDIVWLLAPVALLLVLVFIQTVFWVQALVARVPGAERILVGRGELLQGFLQIPPLLSDLLSSPAAFPLLSWNSLNGLIAMLLVGLIYLAWLAGWWVRHHQPEPNAS